MHVRSPVPVTYQRQDCRFVRLNARLDFVDPRYPYVLKFVTVLRVFSVVESVLRVINFIYTVYRYQLTFDSKSA